MDEQADIILYEKGYFISSATCGLPYYIGGEIRQREDLLLQNPQGLHRRYALTVRVDTEVIAIDLGAKTVTVRRRRSRQVYVETFDKLLLSTGAEPIRPPLAGADHPAVFTLRTLMDAEAIREHIRQCDPSPGVAVVVGGGFIGLEMAENLHKAGFEVHLVEKADQVIAPLDYAMACIAHQQMKQRRIHLWLGQEVAQFEAQPTGRRLEVQLQGGRSILADLVILSVGVRPDISLARTAGLETGPLGGIVVNPFMQTSHPDVYAVGDAVEVYHPVAAAPMHLPLAGPAHKQARIAADNIIEGNLSTYNGTIGVAIAKIFDLTVASAGASGKLLKRLNIPYLASYTHGFSHATYYPTPSALSIKILFSPQDGRLLGAQIAGVDGIDKRIEMLSQVIQRQGTVYDLQQLEHAYAPPYSSATDPVNEAGSVAVNILTGRVKVVHWTEIPLLDFTKDYLLDVRSASEYSEVHIEGATLIPIDELRKHLDEIPRNRRIIVYCAVGKRGYIAARILMQNGFTEVYNLSGGIRTYHFAMR
jgi:NADPH-dependent 2,4-dienoyl-CoA reductase/sulfur reductase-like enzyme/rhodanese-related sulfurtransferase